jgi:hypothetical protein
MLMNLCGYRDLSQSTMGPGGTDHIHLPFLESVHSGRQNVTRQNLTQTL